MARGFATAREAFAEIEARKNSGGGGGGFFFKLSKSGESATVRFLSDEPDWAWVHELPVAPGETYSRTEACRDQDPETAQRNGEACPGCDKQYRRKMQGVINLIWRDAPLLERNAEGKLVKENGKVNVVGSEDQVAKWTVGKVVLEELDGLAQTFKGLTSRDFTVTRRGTGLDTSYDIKPVVDDEGNTVKAPMSENDKKLAEDQPDLAGYFSPPSYEEWGKIRSRQAASGSDAPPSTMETSPFMRNRS